MRTGFVTGVTYVVAWSSAVLQIDEYEVTLGRSKYSFCSFGNGKAPVITTTNSPVFNFILRVAATCVKAKVLHATGGRAQATASDAQWYRAGYQAARRL